MSVSSDDAVELAARTSYGRLVALLSVRSHDVGAAEDALSDAFIAALEQWPDAGVPANPEAWLLATARRRLVDRARHDAVRARAEPLLAYTASLGEQAFELGALPDRRLELLFACAHPAIDPSIHTPLMLQAVLGLDASVIASAFLSPPTAMAQRLVRAKRKIRDAGIRFEIPEPESFPARLEAVLEAIYAAFGTGWDAIAGSDAMRADLANEALYLCRLVVDALPHEAEPRGLLALMLYCDSRRVARRDIEGRYIPLSAQNSSQWNLAQIAEAESLLQAAARLARAGRFQIEAAIQSAHLAPMFGRLADETGIVALYDALLLYAPTVGALVNRAAAVARAHGADAGLMALDGVPADVVEGYQPWWVLRSHLLLQCGRVDEAALARTRAIGLTEDPAVRAFLLGA